MYCLCVNVYCHRVSTQLQLTNISLIIYHFSVLGTAWAENKYCVPYHNTTLAKLKLLTHKAHFSYNWYGKQKEQGCPAAARYYYKTI
jgi:hypothetical protein